MPTTETKLEEMKTIVELKEFAAGKNITIPGDKTSFLGMLGFLKRSQGPTGPSGGVDFPHVTPPSRMARNRPSLPTTLRVCGNTVPVNDGKAGEANPKVLRRKRMEANKRRGLKEDEEQI